MWDYYSPEDSVGVILSTPAYFADAGLRDMSAGDLVCVSDATGLTDTVVKRLDQITTIFAVPARTVELPFSATIPLYGTFVMPQTQVNGPIAFSSAPTPVAGGSCALPLIADGVHVPVFTGFTQSASSQQYNNTSGAINCIGFTYDGANVVYTIHY